MPSYYNILKVSPDADDFIIEAAYRALLKRHHPDVSRDDPARAEALTKEITQAYHVLKDPDARARYDRQLDATADSPEPEPPPSPPASPPPSRSKTRANLTSWAFIGLAALVSLSAVASVVGLAPGASHSVSPGAPAPVAAPTKLEATSGETRPANTLMTWNEEASPGATSIVIEGLTLTLLGRDTTDGRAPVLQVKDADGGELELVGSLGLQTPSADIGVGQIDPASDTPQVVFTTFSGGAHCCMDVQLVEKLHGAWRVTAIATQDGDSLGTFPTDLDGDGRREFSLTDDRFLYAFASYAESIPPPRILSVNNGQVHDVSAEPRFKPVYEAFLTRTQAQCEQHNNGACPAFIAAAARLGKADWAWPIMLAAYDATSDWDLPHACKVAAKEADCPAESQIHFASYPEALRWFLGDAGYMSPVYVPREDDTGPSFSCEQISSQILELICTVPDLANADREMAVAFTRAMALSPDPAALRTAQRRFLAERDASPANVALLQQLYGARIADLQATIAASLRR